MIDDAVSCSSRSAAPCRLNWSLQHFRPYVFPEFPSSKIGFQQFSLFLGNVLVLQPVLDHVRVDMFVFD